LRNRTCPGKGIARADDYDPKSNAQDEPRAQAWTMPIIVWSDGIIKRIYDPAKKRWVIPAGGAPDPGSRSYCLKAVKRSGEFSPATRAKGTTEWREMPR